MKIRIAHSPDSDDAFMFYGLATGQVPTEGFELEHVLSDIETLNHAAFEASTRSPRCRFNAYAHLTDRYILLPHGASMGDRYGPIVVSKTAAPSLKGIRVAVPGKLTTAFLTLRLFDPTVEYTVMPFDKIQEAVHAGEVAGGTADPRRAAHLGRRRTEEDRRSRRVVGRSDRWTAAAARRQRHSPRSRRRRRSRRCRGCFTTASRTVSRTATKP